MPTVDCRNRFQRFADQPFRPAGLTIMPLCRMPGMTTSALSLGGGLSLKIRYLDSRQDPLQAKLILHSGIVFLESAQYAD